MGRSCSILKNYDIKMTTMTAGGRFRKCISNPGSIRDAITLTRNNRTPPTQSARRPGELDTGMLVIVGYVGQWQNKQQYEDGGYERTTRRFIRYYRHTRAGYKTTPPLKVKLFGRN